MSTSADPLPTPRLRRALLMGVPEALNVGRVTDLWTTDPAEPVKKYFDP